MRDYIGKILEIVIAVIIFFLVPVIYTSVQNDRVIQIGVEEATIKYVNTVKIKGYITRSMHEKYLKSLSNTGKKYTVELTHEQNSLEPEYILRNASSVIDDDESLWNGENIYHYKEVITEKPTVIDPVDTSSINTETNESILSFSVRTPPSASHIHSDDCYSGHRHKPSCIVKCGSMTQGAMVAYRDWTESFQYSGDPTSSYSRTTSYRVVICPICGDMLASLQFFDYSDDYGNQKNVWGNQDTILYSGYVYDSEGNATYRSSYILRYIDSAYPIVGGFETYSGGYRIQNPAWTTAMAQFSVFNSFVLSYESIYRPIMEDKSYGTSISFDRYAHGIIKENFEIPIVGWFSGCPKCGKGERYGCGQAQDETLVCSKIITNIVPTNPIQTVYLNNALITTATVTYLDGSTDVVLCNADFIPNNIVQNKSVILKYTSTINDQIYNHTCTILVTVKPKAKTCSNGHTYNLKNDGSDPGCPYCKNWLRSLSVYSPADRKIKMYRGSNLEYEGVILFATYLDGHKEYVYNGYIDNLDPLYVGSQTATIGYKGLTTMIDVEIMRSRKKCDVCGLYYNLYKDDTDPGCPYCKAKVPVFTGNVLSYCEHTFIDEILTELYEGSGIYYFKQGDTFSLVANSTSRGFDVLKGYLGLQVIAKHSEIISNEGKSH